MVCGLYAIIMVAPSSPTALIQVIMKPMIIPFLANGSEILTKTSIFFLPKTRAIFSNDSSTDSNAA